MREQLLTPHYRYPLALLMAAVGLGLQFLITYGAKIQVPGILYPTSFLVAWFFGLGPALAAIFCGALGASILFYEPHFTLKLLGFHDATRLWIFVITSTAAAWIVARGRLAEINLRESKSLLDTFEKKSLEELRQLQNRFERSAEATDIGIWYCDLPFDELIWSRQIKEHFWLPADARVTIVTFYERIHPDDREKTRAAIDKSIADHTTYDIEYRTVEPSEPFRIKTIRAIGWTDYDATGKPIRFDGITLDNTRIRELARQRDESLEVIEMVNRVGTSLSAELDTEKLVQSVTDAATQLCKAQFGAFLYNVTNEKGESFTLYSISGVPREMFSSFPLPRNTAIFAPTFAGSGIVRSNDITKDPRYGHTSPHFGMPKGHLPVVSYLAVPVISRSGEAIGGLFFGHAKPGVFTEREERIVAGLASQSAIAMDNARLYEKAKEAIRIRDEFLSISSHELRTPLTPLKMQLQGISRHLEKGTLSTLPEGTLAKMINTSEKQVTRLTALIEDLLDVSRITSGKLTLNIEPVDLTDVVREIVERYRLQLQSVKCEIRVEAPPHLVIDADRLRIEQVLINLLTNAMRYAPGSNIDLLLTSEDDFTFLKVRDRGIGISAADQKRIFDRFERVLSASNYGGLGLGLFIVHQIVNAHSGTIEVESTPGEGALFTVKLPKQHPQRHPATA